MQISCLLVGVIVLGKWVKLHWAHFHNNFRSFWLVNRTKIVWNRFNELLRFILHTQNGCINLSVDHLNMRYEEDIYSIYIMPSFENKKWTWHLLSVNIANILHCFMLFCETKCAGRFYRFLFLSFCRNKLRFNTKNAPNLRHIYTINMANTKHTHIRFILIPFRPLPFTLIHFLVLALFSLHKYSILREDTENYYLFSF